MIRDSSNSAQELGCTIIHYTTGSDTKVCFNGDSYDYTIYTWDANSYVSTGGNVHWDGEKYYVGGAVLGADLDEIITTNAYTFVYPVDLKANGALDVIAANSSAFMFIDSLHTNSAPTFSFAWGTGNPSCINVIQKYTLSVSDVDNDVSTCGFQYLYYNNTLIYTAANVSVANGHTTEFIYGLNETGTFKANFSCSNHGQSTSYTYVQTVSNSSGCVPQDLGGGDVTPETLSQINATQTFDADVSSFFSNIGVGSSKAKSLIAIILCLILAIGIYGFSQSGLLAVASLPFGIMACYFIGLIGLLPIVVVILVTAALLVYKLINPFSQQG